MTRCAFSTDTACTCFLTLFCTSRGFCFRPVAVCMAQFSNVLFLCMPFCSIRTGTAYTSFLTFFCTCRSFCLTPLTVSMCFFCYRSCICMTFCLFVTLSTYTRFYTLFGACCIFCYRPVSITVNMCTFINEQDEIFSTEFTWNLYGNAIQFPVTIRILDCYCVF